MDSRAGNLLPFLSSDALLSEICPDPPFADTRAELKEWKMHKILKGTIIVLGLAAAPLAMASPASAQGVGIGVHVGPVAVGVGAGFGNVAYGYRDGYWDRGHHWNRWHDQEEMNNYRRAQNNQYHDWRHTRDHDQGRHDAQTR